MKIIKGGVTWAPETPAADGSRTAWGCERGVLAGRRAPVPLNGCSIQCRDDEFVWGGSCESVTCENEKSSLSSVALTATCQVFSMCIAYVSHCTLANGRLSEL